MYNNMEIKPPPIVDHVSMNNSSSDGMQSMSFEQVGSVFDFERGSPTIEKELDEFNSMSSNEREEIDIKLDEKQGLDLDDLGEGETSAFDDVINDDFDNGIDSEGEEIVDDRGELEDYFSSAEFVIWITELILVWGTNFYLKRNNLDSIGIEAFKKTQGEQKFLVKSWAKVLQKNNAKVSPEMELLMALGSTYVMKMKNIVKEQKIRSKEKELEAREEALKKKTKKGKVVDITKHQKTEKEKPKAEVKKEVKKEVKNKGKKVDVKDRSIVFDTDNIEQVEEDGITDLID